MVWAPQSKILATLTAQAEFFIMPDLVSDIIIDDELLERHNSVSFQFNGKLPNIVISSIMPIRASAENFSGEGQ